MASKGQMVPSIVTVKPIDLQDDQARNGRLSPGRVQGLSVGAEPSEPLPRAEAPAPSSAGVFVRVHTWVAAHADGLRVGICELNSTAPSWPWPGGCMLSPARGPLSTRQ